MKRGRQLVEGLVKHKQSMFSFETFKFRPHPGHKSSFFSKEISASRRRDLQSSIFHEGGGDL